MPHSPDLISAILADVVKSYPAQDFEYVIEAPLVTGDRSMQPDIQVVAKGTGRIVCLVEIGYTRPEKLTAYRKTLKVEDVRWYDKQGNLHGDVMEKVVVPRYREPGIPVRALVDVDEPICPFCFADAMAWTDDSEDRGGCRAEGVSSYEVDDDTEDDELLRLDAADEDAAGGTVAVMVSDGRVFCALIYCDKCDRATIWESRSECSARNEFDGEWSYARAHDVHKHVPDVTPTTGCYVFEEIFYGGKLPRALKWDSWEGAFEWMRQEFGDVVPSYADMERIAPARH